MYQDISSAFFQDSSWIPLDISNSSIVFPNRITLTYWCPVPNDSRNCWSQSNWLLQTFFLVTQYTTIPRIAVCEPGGGNALTIPLRSVQMTGIVRVMEVSGVKEVSVSFFSPCHFEMVFLEIPAWCPVFSGKEVLVIRPSGDHRVPSLTTVFTLSIILSANQRNPFCLSFVWEIRVNGYFWLYLGYFLELLKSLTWKISYYQETGLTLVTLLQFTNPQCH